MRFPFVRRLALAALIPALLVVSVVPGCSNESEGERCGDDEHGANNDDCQSGLVCTTIQGEGANVFRCCNPNRAIINDSRCEDTITVVPDAGDDAATGDAGGTSATGGTGGSSAGGGSATGGSGADTAGAAGAAGSN